MLRAVIFRYAVAVGLWVRNCTGVQLTSFGGNMRPMASGSAYPPGYAQRPPSILRVEDSRALLLANLVDQFQFAPDDDWNFVYERVGEAETLTAHCERPVLFTRE